MYIIIYYLYYLYIKVYIYVYIDIIYKLDIIYYYLGTTLNVYIRYTYDCCC